MRASRSRPLLQNTALDDSTLNRNPIRCALPHHMSIAVLASAVLLLHSPGCARQSSDRFVREHSPRTLASERAWADPRRDPDSLRWAIDQLSAAQWREGYGRLVQKAAACDRIGRSTAHSFTIAPSNEELPAAEVSSLIADLLGSTLVDSQDELWVAVRAIDRLADRDKAIEWLVEPPPWPPASVTKYLSREGERAMALIETLAAEVAPEAPARAWLLRSWLSPPRTVDRTLLSELAQAADGRLCRDGRFRAWLHEEWRAWARQRYRRLARWAGSRPGRPPGERTSALR
jgi:hypothetical protein